MDKPASTRGSNGVLLLSNLIHPMNPVFQKFNARDEIHLINNLASSVDLFGLQRQEVTWKPHPAFEDVSQEIKNQVIDTIKEAGFNFWDNAWDISNASNFKYVFSTPSTIALDLLKLGMLTVIIDDHTMAPDNVLNSFPVSTTNPSVLLVAMNSLKDNEKYENLFSKTWQKIGVARPISLACIQEFQLTNDLPENDN